MIKKLMIACLATAAATSAAVAAGASPTSDSTKGVASIDGDVIEAADLKRSVAPLGPRGEALLVNPQRRRQQLEQLIDTRLLAKAATAKGLNDDPEFRRLVEATTARLLAERYLSGYVKAGDTEAGAKAFFNADPARFGTRELHAYHLLFADEKTALAALEDAQRPNADFAALRAKYPGPANVAAGQAGGDLGWFRRGGMVPEFEAAAFATPVGTVYDKPVKTSFGWHVLKVTEARGTDSAKYEDVKAQVHEYYLEHLRATAVAELRAHAKITVNETALRDFR